VTNGWLVLIGLGLVIIGLGAIWWPLALVAAGGMLVTGGLLAEVAEARRRPPEEGSS